MPFSFEGLKFYVSINAPNRTKKAIRDNGGIIIANEAAADVRITDPSRQVPSRAHGAYHSYEWVLDCVRQQRKIDETAYVITRPAAPPPPPPPSRRPAARAAEPTPRPDGFVYAPANSQRRHRNAFTYEDDRILRDWVINEAEYAIKHNEKFLDRGNDMYKRLEDKYPHHTYHSWRNRWLTRLALITDVPVARRQEPRPRAPREREQPQQRSPQAQHEQSEEEEVEDVPDVQPQQQPQQPPPPPPQASPQQARRPAPEAPRKEPQQAAQEETEHDENSGRPDELFFMNFIDYVIISKAYSAWKKEKRESGVSPKPTESFFSKLHQQYPDVSLNDFRRRYHRLRNLYTKPNTTPAGSPGKASAAATSAGPSANHQSPVRNGAPSEAQAAANDEADGNDNNADGMEIDGLDLDDDAILNGVGDHDSAQKEFEDCLNEYSDYLSVYVPPSFYIGGRFLDTYSLWTALQESADNNDRINWDAVIETLGLDKDKHPQLASQLPAWYELNLKEFRSFWNRYKDAVEEAEAEESEDDEEGGDEEEADEEAAGDAQEAPAGPSSGSARRNTGFLSSIRGIFGGGGGGSSGGTPAPESPSKHVRFSGAQPGDGAAEEEEAAEEAEEDVDDDDDDDFENRRVTRSASHQQQTPRKQQRPQKQKRAAALEPETQDFAFDPETQAPPGLAGDDNIPDMEEEDEEEGDDSWQQRGGSSTKATPARQLRTEERIVAAVPQSLPPPGTAKRKRTAAMASAATPAKRQQRKSMA